MFAPRYFAPRYFAPRYFAGGTGVSSGIPSPGESGSPPAGATSVQVFGTFVVPYRVGVVTSWATDHWILPSEKLATSFIVNFNIPAPSGATFDWAILGD